MGRWHWEEVDGDCHIFDLEANPVFLGGPPAVPVFVIPGGDESGAAADRACAAHNAEVGRFGPIGTKAILIMDDKVVGEGEVEWISSDFRIRYPQGDPGMWVRGLNSDEVNAHGFGVKVSEEE